MSALHDALTEYLQTRRALGTKLGWPESSLRRFVDFVETEGAEFITTEIALRWAIKSAGVQRATHARRLGIVRGFAVWLQATDSRTQVPPHRILPARQRRPLPHICRCRWPTPIANPTFASLASARSGDAPNRPAPNADHGGARAPTPALPPRVGPIRSGGLPVPPGSMDRRHLVSARWGLAALLVWTACSDAPTPVSAENVPPVAAAPSATAPSAAIALAYEPGPEPTERLIARAQEAVRTDPERVAAYDELAMVLMRRARETSNAVYRRYAEDALRAARARDEHDPRTMILSALLLQDQHRFADAAALARQYIAAAPDDSTGHLVLGDALLELGDYEPAMDSYQDAMNLRPDLRSYNRAAHMRWLQGDFDGAKQIMELAIDSGSMRDPEAQAWCFVDLGAMYLHRGQAQQAQTAAERALALVPDYVPAIVLDARALARRGDRDAAIERLAPAVDRHPTADELLRLADWLHDAGRTDESSARLAQAERLASAEPRPLALYYARHGLEHGRALALAESELAARHDIASHDVHGLALVRAGRPVDALAAIDRALVLGTKDANLHLHAGLAAKAAGDRVRARAELAAADAIDVGADPLLRDELRAALGET